MAAVEQLMVDAVDDRQIRAVQWVRGEHPLGTGLQVLIEDYVHDAGTKFGVIALLNLATIGGGAFGLVSIARLALGGAA